MLPNHAPLVIAEQFGTLESLYPNRVDLGLGRAPGTDGKTAMAIRRDIHNDGSDFPNMLEELELFSRQTQPHRSHSRSWIWFGYSYLVIGFKHF